MIDRDGPMAFAVGASMSLPLIAPPMRRDHEPADRRLAARQPAARADELLRRGTRCWRSTSRAARSARRPGAGRALGEEPPAHTAGRKRLPSLPETMARVALLSSANTDESARRHADLTIGVRVSGVGLLEFHQIDEARAAGRRAALAALEDAPQWLLRGQAKTSACLGGAPSCACESGPSRRFGEVAVPGLHRHVVVVDEVGDRHPVGHDTDQGAFAQILGQPAGAKDGAGGVVALGRVAAMAFRPQFAHDMLGGACLALARAMWLRSRAVGHTAKLPPTSVATTRPLRPWVSLNSPSE